MAYTSWSVVFGEQPSAAKWNILGTNDASFNDGTGIANDAITGAKIASYYVPAQTDDSNTIANTTLNTAIIQTGWVQVEGDNTNGIETTVTLPVTLSAVHSIVATFIGAKTTGAGASITDFPSSASGSAVVIHISSITTSAFQINLVRDEAVMAAGNWWAVSWIAIGAA